MFFMAFLRFVFYVGAWCAGLSLLLWAWTGFSPGNLGFCLVLGTVFGVMLSRWFEGV